MSQRNKDFEQFQFTPATGPFDHDAYNIESLKRFALGDLDRKITATGGNIFSTKRRRNASGSLIKGWGLLPGSNTIERFAGDGSDGELVISSGTTTINAAGAAIVVKQYTKISITGTADLTISNPHANGTTLILKSQNDVIITSTTSPVINLKGFGGSAGAAVSTSNTVGNAGTAGKGATHNANGGTGGTASAGTGGTSNSIDLKDIGYPIIAVPGGGGASGGYGATFVNGASGAGGKGGGSLIIECGGRYKCTSTLSVAGNNGSAATGTTLGVGGGGGGAGGTIFVLYNSLLSDTGTYTVSGGSGGAGNGAGNNNYYGGGGGASLKNAGSDGAANGGSGGSGANGEAIRTTNKWIA